MEETTIKGNMSTHNRDSGTLDGTEKKKLQNDKNASLIRRGHGEIGGVTGGAQSHVR